MLGVERRRRRRRGRDRSWALVVGDVVADKWIEIFDILDWSYNMSRLVLASGQIVTSFGAFGLNPTHDHDI